MTDNVQGHGVLGRLEEVESSAKARREEKSQ